MLERTSVLMGRSQQRIMLILQTMRFRQLWSHWR